MRRSTACALLGAFLALVANHAASAETTTEEVGAACLAGTNVPEALCSCVAEESANLTDDQRGFYVASFNNDAAEAGRLRSSMPAADLIGIATFMRTSVIDCAKKQ